MKGPLTLLLITQTGRIFPEMSIVQSQEKRLLIMCIGYFQILKLSFLLEIHLTGNTKLNYLITRRLCLWGTDGSPMLCMSPASPASSPIPPTISLSPKRNKKSNACFQLANSRVNFMFRNAIFVKKKKNSASFLKVHA